MHSSHRYGRTVRQSNLQPKLWGSFISSVNTRSPTPHVLLTAWPWVLLLLQPGPWEKHLFPRSLRGSPALCSPIAPYLGLLSSSQTLGNIKEVSTPDPLNRKLHLVDVVPLYLRWRILWTIWANNLFPILTSFLGSVRDVISQDRVTDKLPLGV